MTAVHGPPWTLAADKRAQKERALSADAEKGRGTHGAGAGWRGGESGDWYWHTCTAICKTQLVGPCWIQGAQLSTVLTYTGGVGVAGRLERDRACVYLCLIHADVWQKPIQHCKAISLQLRGRGYMGPPCWLSGKESACQCRRHGFNPWVQKIPWRRKWQLTPVFLPGKSPRQRSLAGVVHGVTKELDRMSWLNNNNIGFTSLYSRN